MDTYTINQLNSLIEDKQKQINLIKQELDILKECRLNIQSKNNLILD